VSLTYLFLVHVLLFSNGSLRGDGGQTIGNSRELWDFYRNVLKCVEIPICSNGLEQDVSLSLLRLFPFKIKNIQGFKYFGLLLKPNGYEKGIRVGSWKEFKVE
jgi:hypothetical protein